MEYDIILPLRTAFAVSQRVLAVISGVLLVLRKNAHSCSKYWMKSGSLRSEVLKRHLGGGCWLIPVRNLRVMGAWSEIICDC